MPTYSLELIKKELLAICKEILEKRVATAQNAMEEAQQAANNEEKSTAGDKYDTSRAMSQNARDMNAKQYQEAVKDLTYLHTIKANNISTEIKSGTVVKSSDGNYFIGISIGQFKYEGDKYFGVSPTAPLGQAFLNKKQGDVINFRGKNITIKEVF